MGVFRLTLLGAARGADDAIEIAQESMRDVSMAATATMKKAGALLKVGGRANIAAAGFSRRWQNAWRVNVYPRSGVSATAAAFGYHKIGYSNVFETGETILPKTGKLWIPLSTVPRVGRKVRPSAGQLVAAGVKLFSIQGRKPILAAKVRAPNETGPVAASLAMLRQGNSHKGGYLRTVPLYVGVDSVTLRKRFDIAGVAEAVRSQLPAIYLAEFAKVHGDG